MKNSRTPKWKSIAAVIIVLAMIKESALAATFNWTNTASGTFVTAANWTNTATPFANGVPGAADNAVNNIAGSTATIGTGDSIAVNTFQASAGNVSITGGTVNVTNMQVIGAGNITQSGGTVTVLSDSRISASSGTWNVSGGTFNMNKMVLGANAGNVGDSMTVSGSGIVNQNQTVIQTGGNLEALWVGGNNGGSGSLLLQDDAQWVNFNPAAGIVIVARNTGASANTGTFTIQDNASFTYSNAMQVAVNIGAAGAATVGTVNLNGGTVNLTGFTKGTGTGTINANGGKITALAANANFFNGFTGTGGNNSVNLLAGGLKFDTAGFAVGINNVLSGVGGLTKLGNGTLTFNGINTYTGDTTISGGTLTLADNAGLKFIIGANGVNNQINGTSILDLLGDFTFDLSGASTTLGDSWLIVDVNTLTVTFDPLFTVNGFAENNNVWILDSYQFLESNGRLSVIPEPSAMALAGIGSVLLFAFNQHRRRLVAK